MLGRIRGDEPHGGRQFVRAAVLGAERVVIDGSTLGE
jgi:hypothetical protein